MNQKPSIYGPRFSWIMTKKWYRVDSAICHISKSRLKKLIKLFFLSEMKKNLYKPNLKLHQTIWDDLFTSKKARDECNGYVWVLGGKFFFTQITGTRLTLLFARIDLDEFIGFRSW